MKKNIKTLCKNCSLIFIYYPTFEFLMNRKKNIKTYNEPLQLQNWNFSDIITCKQHVARPPNHWRHFIALMLFRNCCRMTPTQWLVAFRDNHNALSIGKSNVLLVRRYGQSCDCTILKYLSIKTLVFRGTKKELTNEKWNKIFSWCE